MNVSVIIPTRNAEIYLENLLSCLSNQTILPKEIIIIDSHSKDNTKLICEKFSLVNFVSIGKERFDHGGTRNKAARLATGDILLFMTQDAYPEDNLFIEELISKLGKNGVVASYGRQVARNNASLLEKFAREFNYPNNELIKSKLDLEYLGIKTFFMTNVCSAFLKNEFWKHNGFPEKIILNEDMILSSKIILDNKKVHYAANAKVIHSHNYTYSEQFKRNFDIGVSLVDNNEILSYAKTESEGAKFVKEAIIYLIKNKKAYLIPHLILDSGFRFLGYKLGLKYRKIPKKLVLRMSMHSFYFNK